VAGGYYNTATEDESVVVGGCSNVAGAGTVGVDPECNEFGDSFMAILGGIGNQDTRLGSTISGGESNSVTGARGDAIAGGLGATLTIATGDQTGSAQ